MAQEACSEHFIVGCFECAGEEELQQGVDRMRANGAASRDTAEADEKKVADAST